MGLSELVAVNPVMREILERAERVAPYPTTVLITGETGVGKEVIAAFLHEKSLRSGGPFVKVNCGAIPDSLMESELFGYERGAFTGAKREGSPGLFEAADRGTLLLDEIGELTLAGQVKLLRALQEREVRRVGGTWSRALDVRIIATTNQDLEQRVKEGRFRSDLFYRLRVVHFHIPPLRERSEEIEPLVHHFSQVFSELYGIRKSWDEEALALLRRYPWPGNVRELRHLVESVFVTVPGERIRAADLPAWITATPPAPAGTGTVLAEQPPASDERPVRPLRETVAAAEKAAIEAALRLSPSARQAAQWLEIDHATLLRKMRRYGIKTKGTKRTSAPLAADPSEGGEGRDG